MPPDEAASALATDAGRARWRGSPPVLVAGAAGVLLLGYVVLSLGPERIAGHLTGLGAILPAVLLLTGLKYPLQTVGWRCLLPRSARPSWGESLSATITGDALGYVTWAGPFAGEPMRALLIRDSVPLAEGIAAGAAERALYDVTAAVLVTGVLLALLSVEHGIAALVLVATGLVVVVAAIWFVRRALRPTAEPRGPSVASPPHPGGRIPRLRRTLGHLWRTRRRMLPVVAGLCLAQHALLVGEAYLMLGVLGGTTTIGTALVFEAVTKIVNTAGVVVPARVGISEGGSALLADALGYAASHGVSLALMRRVRALIWAGVGLGLLPLQEMRQRRRRR